VRADVSTHPVAHRTQLPAHKHTRTPGVSRRALRNQQRTLDVARHGPATACQRSSRWCCRAGTGICGCCTHTHTVSKACTQMQLHTHERARTRRTRRSMTASRTTKKTIAPDAGVERESVVGELAAEHVALQVQLPATHSTDRRDHHPHQRDVAMNAVATTHARSLRSLHATQPRHTLTQSRVCTQTPTHTTITVTVTITVTHTQAQERSPLHRTLTAGCSARPVRRGCFP
jgi:hypothetical protein